MEGGGSGVGWVVVVVEKEEEEEGGLQGHLNGTLLIVLSAYANHQLSVSGRKGAAGRYPKTCASYLTCAIS